MAKKECPACAMETDERNRVCHVCGYEFPRRPTGLKWVAILLIVVFLLTLFYFI